MLATMATRSRIEGAIDAVTGILQDGLATVREVHATIARKPFIALRFVPGIGDVSEAARWVHDGIHAAIYGSIRAGIDAGGLAAKGIAAAVEVEDREPRAGSSIDLAVAAINGLAGDRLLRDHNPLAIEMTLRHDGQSVEPCATALRATYPTATARLAIFVHGLAANESTWSFYAREHYGDESTSYGSRLCADLGYTPLYVRYNSGLHVSENGARLAQLIDRIVAEWPVAAEEIILVGHSMGGLVVRSACHWGQREGKAWVDRVRHVFFLGSPHLGAPLEKLGNVATWLLARFDVSQAFAALFNKRSAGIKDLRFGTILDEQWQDSDLDALLDDRTGDVPLLATASHYFVAATVSQDARGPLGMMIGDWLVRTSSATPLHRWRHLRVPLGGTRHFGALSHLQLLNHPDIYDQILVWLRKDELREDSRTR